MLSRESEPLGCNDWYRRERRQALMLRPAEWLVLRGRVANPYVLNDAGVRLQPALQTVDSQHRPLTAQDAVTMVVEFE